MKKPYRVVKETCGCQTCGNGSMWAVVGPGEVQLATSYMFKEDAEYLRDMCNLAFEKGVDRGISFYNKSHPKFSKDKKR
jgi:hypothetical protein